MSLWEFGPTSIDGIVKSGEEADGEEGAGKIEVDKDKEAKEPDRTSKKLVMEFVEFHVSSLPLARAPLFRISNFNWSMEGHLANKMN
jgi:hypothetical protein